MPLDKHPCCAAWHISVTDTVQITEVLTLNSWWRLMSQIVAITCLGHNTIEYATILFIQENGTILVGYFNEKIGKCKRALRKMLRSFSCSAVLSCNIFTVLPLYHYAEDENKCFTTALTQFRTDRTKDDMSEPAPCDLKPRGELLLTQIWV